jgi:hypothetical protein
MSGSHTNYEAYLAGQIRVAEKERDELKKLLRYVMSAGDTLGLRQDKTYTIVLREKLFKAVCEAIK